MAVSNDALMQVVAEIVQEYSEAVDEVIEELVEPIEHVGNPEKLIGKPYEEWTGEDIAQLGMVYGAEGKNPLTKLIIDKEWDKLNTLKREVKEA